MRPGERLRHRTTARMASAALAWRSRPGPVVRALAALPAVPGTARRPDTERLRPAPGASTGAPLHPGCARVAAVQLRARLYVDGGAFVAHLGPWVARAAAAGASLVVLPEDVALGLLGMIPGFERLARRALAGGASGVTAAGATAPGATGANPTAPGATATRVTATGVTPTGMTAPGVTAADPTPPGATPPGVTPTGMTPTGVPAAAASPPAARPAELLAFAAPALERVHRQAATALAARYGVTLVAGTAPALRQGRLLNVSPVFGPDGRLLGEQSKLHPFPHEVGWGIGAGDDLAVWATPAGRLAVAVCMDATYFETFRIARRMGAEVVAVPAADPAAYNPWKALRGPWPRVQESQAFALHSCLVGELAGVTLSGRSAVYAPLELTAAGDGVLAAVPDAHEEGLAVANLDLEALHRLRAARPLPAAPGTAKRWFPGVYGGVPG